VGGGKRVHATEVNEKGKAREVELAIGDQGANFPRLHARQDTAGASIPAYKLHCAVMARGHHLATHGGAGERVPRVAGAIRVAQGTWREGERRRKRRESKAESNSHAERSVREGIDSRL
jgi:hypothetical protein